MRSSTGLERFTVFTDGVAAIAITLMVLPLVDLASSAGHDETNLSDLLHDNTNVIFSFFLSFVVIARLWLGHQSIFDKYEVYTSTVIILGFLWMLTIVLLPFATTLIAEQSHDSVAVGFYIGDMIVSSLCLSLLRLISVRDLKQRHIETDASSALVNTFTMTGLLTVAFLIAVLVPGIGLWALFILFLEGPIVRIAGRADAAKRQAGAK